jgi:hypothetical protein
MKPKINYKNLKERNKVRHYWFLYDKHSMHN